jgi:hypothetical protein
MNAIWNFISLIKEHMERYIYVKWNKSQDRP